jgi:hypothetical protein
VVVGVRYYGERFVFIVGSPLHFLPLPNLGLSFREHSFDGRVEERVLIQPLIRHSRQIARIF